MGALILLSVVLAATSPAGEAAAAIADSSQLSPEDRGYTRYLTTFAVPADQEHAAEGVSFCVNSLSSIKPVRPPRPVTRTVFAVDPRDYGWSIEAWDRLAALDPYYRTARCVIMRADFFIWSTGDTQSPQRYALAYYEFLYGVGKAPKTGLEFQARWGADQAKVEQLGALKRYAIAPDASGVAWCNRRIDRGSTIIDGDSWETFDTKTNVGDQSLADHLDKGFRSDAGELIANVPNGLQAYLLVNGQKKRVEFADPDIVKAPRLTTAKRCIDCHGIEGILTPKEFLAEWIARGVDLYSDKATQLQIDAYYLTDPNGKIIARARERYQEAVKACAPGRTVDEIVGGYRGVFDWYKQPLDLDQAALEVGYTPRTIREALRAYKSPVSLVGLGAGGKIARDEWEQEGFCLLKARIKQHLAKGH